MQLPPRRLVLAYLLASTATGLVVSASQDPQRPVFRSGIDLVAVDVVVLDGDGRPVRGLEAGDFTISVDGKRRDVVSAQYIPQVSSRIDAPSTPALNDVPSFGSNAQAAVGRLIAIVVDVEHIAAGTGREVMDTAGRFLDTLTPEDRVAAVTVPFGGPKVDFTTDHDAVRRALASVTGREGLLPGEFGVGLTEAIAIVRGDQRTWTDVWQRECEFTRYSLQVCIERLTREVRELVRQETWSTRQTLQALSGLVSGFKGIEGPKTVLLLTEGLIETNETRTYFTEFARAAAAASVNLYTISLYSPVIDAQRRLRSLAASQDLDLKMNSLEELTGLARGALFRMSGAGEGIFDRIASELSGYYLLSFEPQGNDRNGKAHRIKVTTNRSDVELRARTEFVVNDRAKAEDRSSPDPKTALTRLLRDPRIVADLPLNLSVYTVRQDDPSAVKLIILMEAATGGLEGVDTDVGFEVTTPEGRIVADASDRVTLTPPDSLTPASHLTAALVEPGAYRLKLAAIDATGRRGSVDLPFDARLTPAGPLQLSDLILGINDGTGFMPAIAATETARELSGFVEIYGMAPADDLDVRLEIAADLRSPALRDNGMSVVPTDDPTRRLAEGWIPVGTLRPGEYLVRAVVSLDGREAGRVSRRYLRR
jgi:VWFA-related protein